ncbi:glycosyltransferase family 2 protein [Gracilimonas sp.]|uniref:glycosyltransferase family 2 protein n=1 Tax=Gracilimonas sp. TaxID=1974203 RepID=UPI00287280C5|nr:glycosyltransferase family 2 protein [Gracilimonas sp.]
MSTVKTKQITENITKESSDIDQTPGVTVGIPVLNEEDHIERVVSGFLNSNYPNLVEVLVADGGSTDRTREIVQELSEKDSRVKLIDNPDKFQSFALNRMIEQAEGEIFLRADGHCLYKEDYLEKNIEVFLETGARNVGGAQRYVAANPIQAGTALAVKSFLGNGGAKYMDENYEGYADTVFLGCFWTEDLREIGGFNTKNITNQDSELNLRLIENFGETVFVSPKIKSWYYPRDSYKKLFKQYFRYGRGRFLTKILHPKSSPIRGLTPFVFIFSLVIYLIADLVSSANLYFPHVAAFLVAVVLIESFRISVTNYKQFKEENWKGDTKSPGVLSLWWHTAFSVVVMQIGHFSGFSYQLLRKIFLRVKGW